MYNVHTYISYVTGKKTPENVNPTENAKMNQKLKEYIYIYIHFYLFTFISIFILAAFLRGSVLNIRNPDLVPTQKQPKM